MQLDYLRAIGCERGQGYLFAKPLDADRLEMFLPQACVGGSLRTPESEMADAS
jgi:EAL domain-containing protein (putative c-di-GMP-specific phosphodiesterase class I)